MESVRARGGGKKRLPRIGFSGSKGDFGDFEVVEGSVVDVLLHKSSWGTVCAFFLVNKRSREEWVFLTGEQSWRECGQSTPQKIDKNVP